MNDKWVNLFGMNRGQIWIKYFDQGLRTFWLPEKLKPFVFEEDGEDAGSSQNEYARCYANNILEEIKHNFKELS